MHTISSLLWLMHQLFSSFFIDSCQKISQSSLAFLVGVRSKTGHRVFNTMLLEFTRKRVISAKIFMAFAFDIFYVLEDFR